MPFWLNLAGWHPQRQVFAIIFQEGIPTAGIDRGTGCYVPTTAESAYYEAVGFNRRISSPLPVRAGLRTVHNPAGNDILAGRGPASGGFQWQPFVQWPLRGRSEKNSLRQ